MPSNRHILGVIEDATQRLTADILKMASLAEQNLAHAIRGLLERDDDLCNRAIADDTDVDLMEKEIDRMGHEIILRFAPVARDLRRVITTMKVSTALERISDHAVSLARRAREINQHAEVPETALVKPIYELAAAQLKQAVDSFGSGDLALAIRIVEGDDPLDIAHYQFIDKLTASISGNGPGARDYVALMFITRLLERIGDQAVNIAEDAIYLLTAHDVRHGGEMPQPE